MSNIFLLLVDILGTTWEKMEKLFLKNIYDTIET